MFGRLHAEYHRLTHLQPRGLAKALAVTLRQRGSGQRGGIVLPREVTEPPLGFGCGLCQSSTLAAFLSTKALVLWLSGSRLGGLQEGFQSGFTRSLGL